MILTSLYLLLETLQVYDTKTDVYLIYEVYIFAQCLYIMIINHVYLNIVLINT